MIQSNAPTNRLAFTSLITAVFTATSFCIGFIPVPLTAWVCYPVAVLLGVTALITGFRALHLLRSSDEKGRGMALAGIWVGTLTIMGVLCSTTITLLLVYYGTGYINSLWFKFIH